MSADDEFLHSSSLQDTNEGAVYDSQYREKGRRRSTTLSRFIEGGDMKTETAGEDDVVLVTSHKILYLDHRDDANDVTRRVQSHKTVTERHPEKPEERQERRREEEGREEHFPEDSTFLFLFPPLLSSSGERNRDCVIRILLKDGDDSFIYWRALSFTFIHFRSSNKKNKIA